MIHSRTAEHPVGWGERAATTGAFLSSGFGIGAWAVAIPQFQHALSLSNGALSLALFGFAAGAVLAMQLAGLMAQAIGTAAGTRLAMLLFAGALALPPLADRLPVLVASALALGAAQGLLDVLMNAHASVVEQRWGAPIMASFHAAFSGGGLAGAACGGALAGGAAGRGLQLAALLGVLIAAACWGGLRPVAPAPRGRARLLLPGRALLPLAAAAMLCMLCEGAMGDWSAVYLATVCGAGAGQAAWGYAGFSVAMVAGRLTGDRMTRGGGPARIVAGGGILAAAGFGIAVAWPALPIATAGFVLVGLGLANVVPAIYSAAGRRGASPASGVAMAATAGYAGFLAGPMLIGFTAQAAGLRGGMLLVLACAVACLSKAVSGTGRPKISRAG